MGVEVRIVLMKGRKNIKREKERKKRERKEK